MSKSTLPREIVTIYRRLPNDIREFPGNLRAATANRLIIESPVLVDEPISVDGEIIADTGYLAIWFVYKGRWYDVGKFYDRAGMRIGYYCDIIKPVKRVLATPSKTVMLTDLFLDLWIDKDGSAHVLDEEELEAAEKERAISCTLAREARRQIRLLIGRVNAGRFPPAEIVRIRPLDKASFVADD
jgi:predicted RNA-binding protein associated with RNAse of E/G family